MSKGKLHSEQRWNDFVNKVRTHGEVWLIGPMESTFPFSSINDSHAVMGVDGGSSKAAPEQYDFTIGDGDSLAAPTTLDWEFPPEKDLSDLALALSKLPSDTHTLHLWGFWGGRFDHQVMNLGEINSWLLKNSGKVTFYINSHERVLAISKGEFTFHHKGIFSLFSLQEISLSIKGDCKYPLQEAIVPPFSSHLLSNEASGEISVNSTGPVFCYIKERP